MNGREENMIKIETKIQNLLKVCPQIINDYAQSFGTKTSKTKEMYIRYVNDYMTWMIDNGYDVNNYDTYKNIKPIDIQKYMTSIEYREENGERVKNGGSIRATRLFAISNFYNYLCDIVEVIQVNPCRKIEVPKDNIEYSVVSLTPVEIRRVLKNIYTGYNSVNDKWAHRDAAIFVLGCSTGLRVTAITEINMTDIDFEKKTVQVVEKGNVKKDVYLGDNTISYIKKWIEDRNEILGDIKCDALFISNRKQRISVRNIEKMLSKYTQTINKHITPHKMRSTCAVNLYNKTRDVYMVQNQLGHKNIKNTERYLKASEEQKRQAASALDNLF